METGVIIAITTAASSLLTILVGKVSSRYFTTKKEDAETLKLLTENEKLSFEAKRFIESAVDERDRNITLKIRQFQKELLEAAEDNYSMKKQLMAVNLKLEEEINVRNRCLQQLNETQKTLNEMKILVGKLQQSNTEVATKQEEMIGEQKKRNEDSKSVRGEPEQG